MTPERRRELRNDYPAPPEEGLVVFQGLIRRDINECLDALESAERERDEARALLRDLDDPDNSDMNGGMTSEYRARVDAFLEKP